jgi:hypothetical protein
MHQLLASSRAIFNLFSDFVALLRLAWLVYKRESALFARDY